MLSNASPIPLDQQVTASQKDRGKIVLVRCHSLKPYLKVTFFQINVQTGQMYTQTQPVTDVGINCQMEEFDLDILKAGLDAMAPPIESQWDEGSLARIPLVQRTGPINEIMTEQEAWDILNRYKELRKLYAMAYHKTNNPHEIFNIVLHKVPAQQPQHISLQEIPQHREHSNTTSYRHSIQR